MALIHSDWLSWCDGWNKASKQTQCKTSVTLGVCLCLRESLSVSVCLGVRLCFFVFTPASLSKCVYVQLRNTVWPGAYVCVYTWQACGTEEKRQEAGQRVIITLLGVTGKTALEPDEVLFTNKNRQIEHHIGVSYPTLSLTTHTHTHAHTLHYIPRGHASLVCHFLCVFMGVCQYGKCIPCLPHFFLLLQIW